MAAKLPLCKFVYDFHTFAWLWGVVLEVVPLFQQSATSIGWTTGTGPQHWPNSHLWIQEDASARHRPHPVKPRWLAG